MLNHSFCYEPLKNMAKLGLLRKIFFVSSLLLYFEKVPFCIPSLNLHNQHCNIEINKITVTRPIVQNCQLKKDD